MPHQATKEGLTDHGFQGAGGLQHFTPNPPEPSNPIPDKSHLIGSRLWHLFLCLGLSEPCLPSTSSAHHPMSRPCLGDGGALRLGPSEWNSVGSSTPRHPQKDVVVRVRVRGGTTQPARQVYTHYGEWCGLTTTAEVRNQETQISHFGSKHFQEMTTKTEATFDTTGYHIWQLSEQTAVSTPSHQRVQDPFILGPSLKSQGRKMDQRRARKG